LWTVIVIVIIILWGSDIFVHGIGSWYIHPFKMGFLFLAHWSQPEMASYFGEKEKIHTYISFEIHLQYLT
jgi:hypothetical protein